MSPFERAKSAFAGMDASGQAIQKTYSAMTQDAATAAATFAQRTQTLRTLLMPMSARLHAWLTDIAFNSTIGRRDLELCIRLDSSMIRSQVLGGLELPSEDAKVYVTEWSNSAEPWGDTASLIVELTGGRISVPLLARIVDGSLSVETAGSPFFEGGAITRSIFANILLSSILFGKRNGSRLPALKFATTDASVSRAHIRQGAARLFNAVGVGSASTELSPLASEAQDVTIFMTPGFLGRLLGTLAGLPVWGISIDPGGRTINLVTGGSKSKGLSLVCEIEVRLTVNVAIRLNIQGSSSILARGSSTSSTLSWDFDGVCSIATDAALSIARALGADIRRSFAFPTSQQPFSRLLQCQGIRLTRLDWRIGGIGIQFRRGALPGELTCS